MNSPACRGHCWMMLFEVCSQSQPIIHSCLMNNRVGRVPLPNRIIPLANLNALQLTVLGYAKAWKGRRK